MTPSKVVDVDGEEFPDCLTAVYPGMKLTEVPVPCLVSQGDLSKFWIYMFRLYHLTYYDDLLLNINQVPYIGLLQPGSTLMNIKLSDLEGFNSNKIEED